MEGVTVVGSDAPSDYHVAARTTDNNPNPQQQQIISTTTQAAVTTTTAAAAHVKKKRGRPRKYAPDGSVNVTNSNNVLSPKPISSSAPSPVIDFSSEKRGKVRPVGLVSTIKPHHHQPKVDLATPGKDNNFVVLFF